MASQENNQHTQWLSEVQATYPVYRIEGFDYTNAIVFDVDDNTMEPTILEGSKVLATYVEPSQWQYINSGLYIIMYAGYMQLKRLKSNDIRITETLTLHSDNTTKAGTVTIDSTDIRHIWQFRATIYAVPK